MLANRKLKGTWSGGIFVNNALRSKSFNRDTAYVLQDDVHFPTLTVEETIYYAAWTRLPEGTSQADIQTRVEMLMETMSITHLRDCRVGDAMTKGLSGGQIKRLSIAVEIVALSNCIFLDEPTSGLDSSIALEVYKYLCVIPLRFGFFKSRNLIPHHTHRTYRTTIGHEKSPHISRSGQNLHLYHPPALIRSLRTIR